MNIQVNPDRKPQFLVVDNFLSNPDEVRREAMKLEFAPKGSQGVRSQRFPVPVYKAEFERLLGRKIVEWNFGVNGAFQWCVPKRDQIIFHCDEQTHGGILFLTPHAPPASGTTFYRHKTYKVNKPGPRISHGEFFRGGFHDASVWEPIDTIGNVYNRLALWEGKNIHAASSYFGEQMQSSRFFQIFFFNCEPDSAQVERPASYPPPS